VICQFNKALSAFESALIASPQSVTAYLETLPHISDDFKDSESSLQFDSIFFFGIVDLSFYGKWAELRSDIKLSPRQCHMVSTEPPRGPANGKCKSLTCNVNNKLREARCVVPACRRHGFPLLSAVLANDVRKMLERGVCKHGLAKLQIVVKRGK
jgi:hypothetical protein